MRFPMPRNKLVVLSLAGALLAVGGAVALASPALISADATPPGGPASTAPAAHQLFEHDGYEHESEDDDH